MLERVSVSVEQGGIPVAERFVAFGGVILHRYLHLPAIRRFHTIVSQRLTRWEVAQHPPDE